MSEEEWVHNPKHDVRAGNPQPWWDKLITLMIAQPDLGATQLAEVLGRSRQVVNSVMRCTAFQPMIDQAKAAAGKLPVAREAMTALTNGGIKFNHSRGQMIDTARDRIMDALNDETTMVVIDKEGRPVVVPMISKLEKAKLAVDTIKALTPPKSTVIGKQTNIQNNGGIVVTKADMDEMEDSLKELMSAVQMSIPTRRVNRKDGAVEIVMDVQDAEGVDA